MTRRPHITSSANDRLKAVRRLARRRSPSVFLVEGHRQVARASRRGSIWTPSTSHRALLGATTTSSSPWRRREASLSSSSARTRSGRSRARRGPTACSRCPPVDDLALGALPGRRSPSSSPRGWSGRNLGRSSAPRARPARPGSSPATRAPTSSTPRSCAARSARSSTCPSRCAVAQALPWLRGTTCGSSWRRLRGADLLGRTARRPGRGRRRERAPRRLGALARGRGRAGLDPDARPGRQPQRRRRRGDRALRGRAAAPRRWA